MSAPTTTATATATTKLEHCDDDEVNTNEQTPCLSKSQRKRLKKREKWVAQKGERRKLERKKRKLKRKENAEERIKLGLENTGPPKTKLMSESNNNYRVVIDMDFNEQMTDAEMAAAAKQVGRIYSLNRHSENPCQLYVSSLKGKVGERFASTNTGYTNWDCNISELNYVDIFRNDSQSSHGRVESNQKQFVYLTGDAEEDLPNVENILKDESKIYVIGGLVDHNRHKRLCYNRATERNIQTAKLPIARYVKLSQRSILSTVAVFEIMLNILGAHKTWPEALVQAIPKRKIAHPNGKVETDDSAKAKTKKEK